MNNKISKINGLTNNLNIFFHLTDFCNFSCRYCILGKKFSGLSIQKARIDDFLFFLDNILEANIYKNIKIVISGGEPSLSKDFFYLIEGILKRDNKRIFIQITTNGFVLSEKHKSLLKLGRYNIDNLYFNISYHYFEYIGNIDSMVKTLNLLRSLGFIYKVNFLLPDDTELNEFLSVFNYIREKSNFTGTEYRFSLINMLNGNTSEKYKKQVLDFYHKNDKGRKSDLKNIMYSYDNGANKLFSSRIVQEKGLNNYFGYKCYFVNENNVNININTDGSITFGICSTLNNVRYYSFQEIYNLIFGEKRKSIICGDNYCNTKWELFLDKEYHKNTSYDKVLKEIYTKIFPPDMRLAQLSYSSGNFIQFQLEYDNMHFFYKIEILKQDIDYKYKSSRLGYHSFIKDYNFKLMKEKKQFAKYLKFLYGYNRIFERIIIG